MHQKQTYSIAYKIHNTSCIQPMDIQVYLKVTEPKYISPHRPLMTRDKILQMICTVTAYFVQVQVNNKIGKLSQCCRAQCCRAQWLRGRVSDCRLREPRFESCAAVLKSWASFFTLHCSSSLSCINEYLAIDSGGYVYEHPSRINCSIWLDASQRSGDGVWVNKSVREVKCKALWTMLGTGYCAT